MHVSSVYHIASALTLLGNSRLEKLLIVEDDAEFSQALSKTLVSQGWMVETAGTGRDGLQLLTNFRYDFVLLDWDLPDITGLEICRQFRTAGGATPVIFVTGRSDIEDREAGLDCGGDDYITKPFDVRELLARIRAIQRRPRTLERAPLVAAQGLALDPLLRTAVSNGKSVQLSLTESNILEFFLRNRNRFFSAVDVFEEVWPSDSEASVDTVKVTMGLLRRKLTQLGAEGLISTVKGSGYILRE
jgi:OmpR-family two-component system manganese-sensing response regulator